MKKKKIPQIVKRIREYQPLEINYAYQKNVSYSQFSLYQGCPLRWQLQYKNGYKIFTSSIHTIFGTAIHEAIQHYLNVMYEQSAAAADREDIESIFEEKLREEYKTQYQKNKNQHFSSPEELREFFEDGRQILGYFKKKKGSYFSKKGWYLVGCEIPVITHPHPYYKNVLYQGYLDVVLYHEPTNKFKIIDIKTSTRGWNNDTKKNEDKQFQLILYKKFFSEIYNVPLENIDIEFLIVKRKIYEDADFPISRIQLFSPASGKVKLNKANTALNNFIEEAFTKSEYRDKEHKPTPTQYGCNYCPFKDNPELCKHSL